MKAITLIFLTLFLSKSCSQESKKDIANTTIEYVANTRGFYQKTIVKNQMISISKDRDEKGNGITTTISNYDWKELIAYFEKLDLDSYMKAEHVLARSRRKGMGLEDFELSRLGLQRRIRLRCQHYFAACRVVSQTDLLLTMPERFARIANEHFDNQILALPLPMPSWDVYLYWHQNVENDPANCWLRDQVTQAFLIEQ